VLRVRGDFSQGAGGKSTVIERQNLLGTAGSAYTFDHHLNGDAVTIILQVPANGVQGIAWQAAATPNGGTAANSAGSF
jgi:hypothetical protein